MKVDEFQRKKGSNRIEIHEFSTRKGKPRVWDGENFETSNMKTSSVIKNQVQNSFSTCFYLFSKRENGISFTEPISKNFRISPNLPSRIFVHYQCFQRTFSWGVSASAVTWQSVCNTVITCSIDQGSMNHLVKRPTGVNWSEILNITIIVMCFGIPRISN